MTGLGTLLAATRPQTRTRAARRVTVMAAEWRWAIAASAAVMTLACLPYLVAVVQQDSVSRFTGFLITADDGNTYLAKMLQGARGAWLYTSAYAAEPGRPVLLFPFYYLLGKLTGADWTLRIVGFHLARVVFGFGYLVAAYAWLAEFVPRIRGRRLAFWLLALGGGLGWLALGAGGATPRLEDLPLDLYLPEAFSFLSLLTLPHLAAARLGLVVSLVWYRRGRAPQAGLALMAVAFLVPLYPLVAGLLLVLGELGELASLGFTRAGVWAAVARLAWLLAPSAPYVVYVLALTSLDRDLAEFMGQNILLSPAPWHYALAYGPWLICGAWGWRALRRDAPSLAIWATVWLALGIALTYIPITTQRRIIDGYWLWLAPVAARGLTLIARGTRWRRLILPALMVVTLPGPLLAWGGALSAAWMRAPVAFIPSGQVAAFDWLRDRSVPEGVALTSFQTGNWVPAFTPYRAYLGHGVETPNIHATEDRVARFFSVDATNTERMTILREGTVTVVLWGPEERALGGFDPHGLPVLEPVYAADGYEIFEVRTDVAP